MNLLLLIFLLHLNAVNAACPTNCLSCTDPICNTCNKGYYL